jgi:hypothetical protein
VRQKIAYLLFLDEVPSNKWTSTVSYVIHLTSISVSSHTSALTFLSWL